ncbi:hypothetical protein ACFQHV_17230 [Promicromonospora thailandica]|uniref:hypothetical protein n=1 Tax=Promicromonospora thailandica TaxID=765201 RepID=UPI0020A5031E|nr:hypothetical protein [Promicromonospora thailandica]
MLTARPDPADLPVRPARPAGALVESPLQLLCTVEAHAAGLGGAPTRIHVRDDVPALDTALEAVRGFGLPDDLETDLAGRRAALSARDPVWLVGDAFSGLFQATALLRCGVERVVLVDDGLATLDLARRLAASEPLVRMRAETGGPRRQLGAAAARRLRRLAADGRVTLFTALPLEPAIRAQLSAQGFAVVRNDFAWLAGAPVGDAPTEPTVVIGSALPADGLVDADAYVTWVGGLAAQGPLRYLPHRRQTPRLLARLGALPGVTVDSAQAPVELRLRGMTAPQRVVSLPSTAAVLLTSILSPRGVAVIPQAVADDWWTSRATPGLRAHLSGVLRLAADAAALHRSEPTPHGATRPVTDQNNPEDHG